MTMTCLRAIPVYSDSKLSLIAVESIERRDEMSTTGCRLLGNIKPVAVIVCAADGIHALGIEEEFVAIDPLLKDVPGLEAMIASLNNR